MFAPIRCEADLYGYSYWLSYHLKLNTTPVSKRGFQHGWIWWDPTDLLPYPGFGLDPNTNRYWGLLTQDNSIARSLMNFGTYAAEGGLPFLNYYHNSGLFGRFKEKRKGRILFVPTHSNPWNDYSDDILQSILDFSRIFNTNFTVMIGGSDRSLQDALTTLGIPSVLGAQVNDVLSFIRLQENFESHEFMITDSIGSHICYGLHCGMKVGILKDEFEKSKARPQQQFQNGKAYASLPNLEAREYISSSSYINARYPGLVYSEGLPTYDLPPPIPNINPETIANLLGWDLSENSHGLEKTNGNVRESLVQP
jgi:hypothetical protein